MEENPGMAHKIILNNRNQGNLTGILDVISFDENTIVLDAAMGLLTIKGKGAKSGESFFAKLFK